MILYGATMYVIDIKETPADYEKKSTEISFDSKWEAECFVWDFNIKKNTRDSYVMFFMVFLCFLIFAITVLLCTLPTLIFELHKISGKL